MMLALANTVKGVVDF